MKKFFCYDTDRKNNMDNSKALSEICFNDIADKPFGDGEIAEVELMPYFPVLMTYIDDWGMATADIPYDANDIVEGQKYTVYFDGVEYECVGMAFPDGAIIGNPYIASGGELEDNGMQFAITVRLNDMGAKVVSCIMIGSGKHETHTIRIVTNEEHVDKIDPKYIPRELARVAKFGFTSKGEPLSAEVFNAFLAALRESGLMANPWE